MLEERRHTRRITYPFKIAVFPSGQDPIDVFRTENISTGGVRIISQHRLDINTQVEVTMHTAAKPITTRGKVVWFLEIKAPRDNKIDLYDIGIEFMSMSAPDRQQLEAILADLKSRPID
jgi:c-di-GMP-binding flagellar brake protein YcgR